MKREEYIYITRLIIQTVRFLNRDNKLDQDDMDEILNHALLKLTPQLKKILHLEPLHLRNFVRKTARNVFWDYLKGMSADLTGYRFKKQIKQVLTIENIHCRFRRPDNDTPWYSGADPPDTSPGEKEKQEILEKIIQTHNTHDAVSPDPLLTHLVKTIFKHVSFGVSINQIHAALCSHENIRQSLHIPPGGELHRVDEDISPDNLPQPQESPSPYLYADERDYYQNLAEEFINRHAPPKQAWVYYLKFAAQLGYREIEEKHGINIKTAESRLSHKADKKGFAWRLGRFVKDNRLTPDEAREFFYYLNRKTRQIYSNYKPDE